MDEYILMILAKLADLSSMNLLCLITDESSLGNMASSCKKYTIFKV